MKLKPGKINAAGIDCHKWVEVIGESRWFITPLKSQRGRSVHNGSGLYTDKNSTSYWTVSHGCRHTHQQGQLQPLGHRSGPLWLLLIDFCIINHFRSYYYTELSHKMYCTSLIFNSSISVLVRKYWHIQQMGNTASLNNSRCFMHIVDTVLDGIIVNVHFQKLRYSLELYIVCGMITNKMSDNSDNVIQL